MGSTGGRGNIERAQTIMWRALRVMLLALLALGVGPVGMATAQSAGEPTVPASVQDLLEVYGIASEPADFVVVIDTSGSMSSGQNPPYPGVVSAFGQFTEAAGTGDVLSLITFDQVPNLRFQGPLNTPEDRASAAASLPNDANGRSTDIGAALDATLTRLERPGSSEVQIVMFLTDGRHEPAPGSAFAQTSGPAWDALRERAERVAAGHQLVVFGVGLGPEGSTDIGLLHQVFAGTQVVSLPADQLPAFFQEAVDRSRIERLRDPVGEELADGSVAAVVTEVGELGDPTRLTVRLRSSYTHLPVRVELRGVTVTQSDGTELDASFAEETRTFLVPPGGESEAIAIDVHPSLEADGGFGTREQASDLVVSFEARARVEPAELLAQTLAVDASTSLAQPETVTATRTVGTPWSRLIAYLIALGVALLILLAIYRRFFRLPPLPGGLLLDNKEYHQFDGTSFTVPNRKLQLPKSDGASVEFFTRRGKFRGRPFRRIPKVYARTVERPVALRAYGARNFSTLSDGQIVATTDNLKVGRAIVTVMSKRP